MIQEVKAEIDFVNLIKRKDFARDFVAAAKSGKYQSLTINSIIQLHHLYKCNQLGNELISARKVLISLMRKYAIIHKLKPLILQWKKMKKWRRLRTILDFYYLQQNRKIQLLELKLEAEYRNQHIL